MRLSVSISPRNLYNSLKSIKEKSMASKLDLAMHISHLNKILIDIGWSGGAMVLGKLPVPGVLQFG